MKVFKLRINITSTTFEIADAFVEAETLEEAIELFNANPWYYDWDNWETIDSETNGWEVDGNNCDYSHYIDDKGKNNADVQSSD